MGQFDYQAVCRDGTVTRGTVSGKSRGEATRQLQEQGMQILILEEAKNRTPEVKSAAKATQRRETRRVAPS
ncbi:MAG: hypothetical protein ABL994_10820, partial [Verrucomicrobiales bacterium]